MSLNPRIPFMTTENSSIFQDVLTITKKIGRVKRGFTSMQAPDF
jgi:hypothetical protein